MTLLLRPTARVYSTDEVTCTWLAAFTIDTTTWQRLKVAETPLNAKHKVDRVLAKRPAAWSWAFARKLHVPGWKKPAAAVRTRTVRNRFRKRLRNLQAQY